MSPRKIQWEDRGPEEWEKLLSETDVIINEKDMIYIRRLIEELKDKDKDKTGYYLYSKRGFLNLKFHELGICDENGKIGDDYHLISINAVKESDAS